MEHLMVHILSIFPFWYLRFQIWVNIFQIRVVLGLRRPQETLLFNKILNVKLLLFMALIVVLLLPLTVGTVFSAQR